MVVQSQRDSMLARLALRGRALHLQIAARTPPPVLAVAALPRR